MKIKDKKELHNKNEDELRSMLKGVHEELEALRLDKTQNKVKNTSELTNMRRKIAVLQTILQEKELNKNG
jgi:ribosomal protein L29